VEVAFIYFSGEKRELSNPIGGRTAPANGSLTSDLTYPV